MCIKLKVSEDQLRTNISNQANLSGITLKFSFTAEPHWTTDANSRQATHAITAAMTAVNPISSTPAAISFLDSVVNHGMTITPYVQKMETSTVWTILMDRIKLLNMIITSIAEVFSDHLA